jgi:hypothetical protein
MNATVPVHAAYCRKHLTGHENVYKANQQILLYWVGADRMRQRRSAFNYYLDCAIAYSHAQGASVCHTGIASCMKVAHD